MYVNPFLYTFRSNDHHMRRVTVPTIPSAMLIYQRCRPIHARLTSAVPQEYASLPN